MKRLTAITNGDLEYTNVSVDVSRGEGLSLLKELDSAEVKTNTCPYCTYSPLENEEGLKVCKNCGSAYKIFNDNVYIVV